MERGYYKASRGNSLNHLRPKGLVGLGNMGFGPGLELLVLVLCKVLEKGGPPVVPPPSSLLLPRSSSSSQSPCVFSRFSGFGVFRRILFVICCDPGSEAESKR